MSKQSKPGYYLINHCPFYVEGKSIKDYTPQSKRITLPRKSIINIIKEVGKIGAFECYTIALFKGKHIIIPHVKVSCLTRDKDIIYLGMQNSKLAGLFFL